MTEALGVGIQIRWRESDLSVLETDPMRPGIKFAASSTTAPSITTSISKPTTTSEFIGKTGDPAINSGLGPGAKVGIGIGAALSVLALVVIGFLVWRRRHRYNSVKNTSDEAGNDTPEMVASNWSEGHDLPVVVQDKKGELSIDSLKSGY